MSESQGHTYLQEHTLSGDALMLDFNQQSAAILDEARQTREETTAAVHFLKFQFTPSEIEMFASGPVHIVVDHPAYDQDVTLDVEQHETLLADLRSE